jgi:hypothetical protein
LYQFLVLGVNFLFYLLECKAKKQVGSGVSNLRSHLTQKHNALIQPANESTAWQELLFKFTNRAKAKGPMYDYLVVVSEEAKELHMLMKLIIKKHLAFSTIEDPDYRCIVRGNITFSVEKLLKNMSRVAELVSRKIAQKLPPTFGFYFDGWSQDNMHLCGVYASYVNEDNVVCKPMLSCGPIHDPEAEVIIDEHNLLPAEWDANNVLFGANEMLAYFNVVLSFYPKEDMTERTIENSVEFFGADNCSTNQAIANYSHKCLIGCKSHIFHLAVSNFLSQFEAVIKPVSEVMEGLSNSKNGLVLATQTSLQPTKMYRNRWSGIMASIRRWNKLKEIVYGGLENFTNSVATPADILSSKTTELNRICALTPELESITKQLQDDNLTLLQARTYFKNLLLKDEYRHNAALKKYLRPESDIIHSKNFESAIEKIQSNFALGELIPAEAEAVQMFVRNDEVVPPVVPFTTTSAASVVLMSNAQCSAQVALGRGGVKYRSVAHVLPTSNVLERMFSQVKLFYTDHRHRISPINLEASVYLHANMNLWDEMTVHEALQIYPVDYYKWADHSL